MGCCGCAQAIASVLSQIVDTFIFITVAFYGVFPITELIARPDAGEGRAVDRCWSRLWFTPSSPSDAASTGPSEVDIETEGLTTTKLNDRKSRAVTNPIRVQNATV